MYCSKDCELEKRPEHHVVCKERRNHLRRINELKKDLNDCGASGSEYNATLKKLEKVTYEMAEEKVDYHLFEKAYEFFRLSIEYCRPEQGSEMLETIAKTLGYQLILNYEEYGEGKHGVYGVYGVYYNIPLNILLPRIESQDGLEIAKFAPEIRALVSRIKQMNIPELCDYMNSYETLVSVLRSASRDSVYYQVYCKDIPLRKIKQFLEIEMEKDYKAFENENLEDDKATMNDFGIPMYVWEDLLLWQFPYFMGRSIAEEALSAFLHQHPQIHRYLKRLFFEWKAEQEAEFEDSGEEESSDEEEFEEEG